MSSLLTASAWSSTGLNKSLINALTTLNLIKPTKIQQLAIPHLLSPSLNGNTLISSSTGTGKSLAYILPLTQILKQQEANGYIPTTPRILITVPIKELVNQHYKTIKQISHYMKFRVRQVYDRIVEDELFNCDVVVSTPGKIMYHFNKFGKSLEWIVYDEADLLFSDDYKGVKELVGFTSGKNTKSVYVSATPNSTIPKPYSLISTNANTNFGPSSFEVPKNLRQRFIKLDGYGDNKQKTLLKILQEYPPSTHKTLVFCNTFGSLRALEGYISSNLPKELITNKSETLSADEEKKSETFNMVDANGNKINRDYSFSIIHSHLDLKTRFGIINSGFNLLLSTDLLSRGVDLDFYHVINYDFPMSFVDYVNRVGRVGRNGKVGLVSNLVSQKDTTLANDVKKIFR